jgi:hypothetical protein
MSKTLVSIVMGSDSDLEIMREAGKALEEFGIAYEMDVTSAHRSPDRTADFARKAAWRRGASGWGDRCAYHFAGDWSTDPFYFVAGDGFSAGDRSDAGGNSGGDSGDWKAGRDECGNSCGANDWIERCIGCEEA